MSSYHIVLAKENFKFSAGHFTVFSNEHAELLHGHNYKVQVELHSEELDGLGFVVDFAGVKQRVREVCAQLDERILLPEQCRHLETSRDGSQIEVAFGDRRYQLPFEDVVLLPLVNTTVELLAQWLWEQIVPAVVGTSVEVMSVDVEETAGQRAGFRAAVPS